MLPSDPVEKEPQQNKIPASKVPWSADRNLEGRLSKFTFLFGAFFCVMAVVRTKYYLAHPTQSSSYAFSFASLSARTMKRGLVECSSRSEDKGLGFIQPITIKRSGNSKHKHITGAKRGKIPQPSDQSG